MTIFSEKILSKCEKVDFRQIWPFFIAEMVEACIKTAGSNWGVTATPKIEVAIVELECNFH